MSLPVWLYGRLATAGGRVPFSTYMEWVLHDPVHGAYGSGLLQIGPQGDFATAPSLGCEFAALLAPQVAAWLEAIPLPPAGPPTDPMAVDPPLALVETGPGEGHLARQLAEALAAGWPSLAAHTELVLVEPNPGMAARQRSHLATCPLPVRWADFAELAAAPVRGVVIAHEVLDALMVERIERRGRRWCRQMVALDHDELRLEAGDPLDETSTPTLEALGLLPMVEQRGQGWCTELHPALEPWLAACAQGLRCGQLLVIDYALEAWRYYAPHRSSGTLLAYRGQRVSVDPLLDPGHWDLTAHLCLDTLIGAAAAAGWCLLGQRRQGEALLALGLAARLHGLQQGDGRDLAGLLHRRESLLRLVDPTALGDFRWVAFERGLDAALPSEEPPLFLRDPGPDRSDVVRSR